MKLEIETKTKMIGCLNVDVQTQKENAYNDYRNHFFPLSQHPLADLLPALCLLRNRMQGYLCPLESLQAVSIPSTQSEDVQSYYTKYLIWCSI